eukprot:CAMPEP_0182432332 /NCGR_PEP_ID=MMETSP1167-20130531/55563_1 /TAXON_ID=2988 /ORGANISM="Mallomonas Sp, Strain CCMP3275" /LENGTH=560 /DNA_ID=CAMNT_0024619709 /DNA_START=40 /DNA_END=1722 /DNA_ORIENTATION=-
MAGHPELIAVYMNALLRLADLEESIQAANRTQTYIKEYRDWFRNPLTIKSKRPSFDSDKFPAVVPTLFSILGATMRIAAVRNRSDIVFDTLCYMKANKIHVHHNDTDYIMTQANKMSLHQSAIEIFAIVYNETLDRLDLSHRIAPKCLPNAGCINQLAIALKQEYDVNLILSFSTRLVYMLPMTGLDTSTLSLFARASSSLGELDCAVAYTLHTPASQRRRVPLCVLAKLCAVFNGTNSLYNTVAGKRDGPRLDLLMQLLHSTASLPGENPTPTPSPVIGYTIIASSLLGLRKLALSLFPSFINQLAAERDAGRAVTPPSYLLPFLLLATAQDASYDGYSNATNFLPAWLEAGGRPPLTELELNLQLHTLLQGLASIQTESSVPSRKDNEEAVSDELSTQLTEDQWKAMIAEEAIDILDTMVKLEYGAHSVNKLISFPSPVTPTTQQVLDRLSNLPEVTYPACNIQNSSKDNNSELKVAVESADEEEDGRYTSQTIYLTTSQIADLELMLRVNATPSAYTLQTVSRRRMRDLEEKNEAKLARNVISIKYKSQILKKKDRR